MAEVKTDQTGKQQCDDIHPLKWTRKFAGGFVADIKRRGPYYVSDWTDAFTAKWGQKCLASTTFLFFACLAPAITFGALFDKDTDGQLGAFEMVLSSSISGIIYAFFAGQPLCIMGATGPELAYTVVFYDMCKNMDLEFLPARVWEGLWCALFTVILALTDGSSICVYVTQFTEDVFSALISLIFIIEAFINIGREFEKTNDVAFFSVVLALGAFSMAMYCRSVKNSNWMTKLYRNIVANFGVTISILVFSGISIAFKDVKVKKLSMPEKFEPSFKLANGTTRPWVVNPFGMEKDFPVWGIFWTILPAIGLCILGFLDQNLTSLLINRKSSNLKKPAAYHLDLFVCGIFIYPICAIFGLPFTHAATIRSLTHLISVTDFEEVMVKTQDNGVTKEVKMKMPVAVAEQRVTQLGIHTLIGCSTLLGPLLKHLPNAVLYGVFLFMGATTISGNALFDRMSLWMIWDRTKYPAYPFIQGISFNKLHAYTFIQFLCLVVLYGLKSYKPVAVAFPFFLIVIVLVRMWISKFFTKEELAILDGSAVEEDEKDDKNEPTKESSLVPSSGVASKQDPNNPMTV